MRDKGVAHIGIGYGKGETKATDAVKMAVESPLLETTVSGATDVIINISGDISLADASDAASYVQDQAGDDVNIIFGAMYDDSNTDSCDVTVIATGIGSKDTVPMNNYPFGAQNTRKTGSQASSYKSSSQRSSSSQSSRNNAGSRPAPSTSAPRSRQDNVEIPSFLRQPRR
jgi:cell division protein FtsZ